MGSPAVERGGNARAPLHTDRDAIVRFYGDARRRADAQARRDVQAALERRRPRKDSQTK